MKAGKGVHTVPNKAGAGWVNEEDGRTISNHRTKEAAVKAGRAVAKRQAVEHTIHKMDGSIGEKNSYGKDPNPPRG